MKPASLGQVLASIRRMALSRGYFDWNQTIFPIPFSTREGILLARGTFVGPTPFAPETRAPEDLSRFYYFVFQNEFYKNEHLVVVKHGQARIAEYRVTESGLEPTFGEIPAV